MSTISVVLYTSSPTQYETFAIEGLISGFRRVVPMASAVNFEIAGSEFKDSFGQTCTVGVSVVYTGTYSPLVGEVVRSLDKSCVGLSEGVHPKEHVIKTILDSIASFEVEVFRF